MRNSKLPDSKPSSRPKFAPRFARMILLAAMATIAVSLILEASQAFGFIPSNLASDVAEVAHGVEAGAEGAAAEAEHVPGIIENLTTLAMLILLQAVLGFDNLLYISLESKHAPADKRQSVRAWGIGIAIFLRIALLFALYFSLEFFEKTSVFQFDWNVASGNFNLHSVIVLLGGGFIIYTAMKEIWHMTRLEHHDDGHGDKKKKTLFSIVTWIVIMNVVFSFDSILSAMALSDVLWVMTIAIVISGLLMIWLSDHVSTFLEKNRMYEVLGLFVLFVVGIMLVSEGGHLAHLNLFGNAVEPMTKTTFYFVLAVLVLTDLVQTQYQKKLLASKKATHA